MMNDMAGQGFPATSSYKSINAGMVALGEEQALMVPDRNTHNKRYSGTFS